MNLPEGFWIPMNTPPQVSDEAREEVMMELLLGGVVDVVDVALGAATKFIDTRHEPLAGYLDRLGFDLNRLSSDGPWPARVLRIGAGMAALAYNETGYYQAIDEDAFQAGAKEAVKLGIPEAYVTSMEGDINLRSLGEAACEAPELRDDLLNQWGHRQVLDIGAGCTRHYLQQVVAPEAA